MVWRLITVTTTLLSSSKYLNLSNTMFLLTFIRFSCFSCLCLFSFLSCLSGIFWFNWFHLASKSPYSHITHFQGTTFTYFTQEMLTVVFLCNPNNNIWKLVQIFPVWQAIRLFITHILLHLI